MSTQFTNRQWRLPNNENKDKQSNYSMDFDGTQLVLQGVGNFTSFNGVSECSVSLWFKSSTSQGPYKWFFNVPSNTSGSHGFGIYASGTGLTSHVFTTSRVEVVTSFSGNQWDGNWHHLVLTYKDGVGLRLYYDSVLQFTNNTMSGTITAGGEELAIGGFSTGYPTGGNIIAQIDGVSAFTYALSQIQITTLYGSSSTGIGNPMSLSPAPVAYYPLGDQDAFNGADYLVPNSSLKDFVFDFTIAEQSVDIPNDFNNYTEISVSTWVNFNNFTGYQYVFSTAAPNNGAGTIFSIASITSSGVIYSYDGVALNSTGVAVILNTWNHISVTQTGTTRKVFINGQQAGNDITTASLNLNQGTAFIGKYHTTGYSVNAKISNVQVFNTALPATGSNSVETLYNNGSPLTSMSGFTSLQGWWKLDASATYDGSDWTIPDDSSNSNDGTSSGMTQANLVQSDLSFTSGYSPYALDFDGTNDYIDCGATVQQPTTNYSVSCWVKLDSVALCGIIGNFKTGVAPQVGFAVTVGSGLNFQFWADGTASSSAGTVTGTSTPNSSTWYNVIGTYNGSLVKIYVNNVLENSVSYSATPSATDQNLVVGRWYGNYDDYYTNGSISNVSIWNTALTPAQVTEIYSEGVPQNLLNHSAVSSLVSWWQLGSNSSFNTNWTVLDEVTASGNNGTSVNMIESDITDGVNSYANGLSSGMGGDEVIGDAPYSSSNSLSVNMDVEDRTTDTPS